MKVAITGKNSYIGENIKRYLEKFGYEVTEIDMIDDSWKKHDFSDTDAVIHVAAIVHENAKNSSEDLFYCVNAKLPEQVAKRAKTGGVGLFVFLSTMAVYGCDKKLPKGNIITKNTETNPATLYGKSKLAAERKLLKLNDDFFRIAIVRPPNVYGKGCKGNYMSGFCKLSSKFPIFPKVYLEARQSMLHIDNLVELVRLIVENNSQGVFTPQDDEIPNACELVYAISKSTQQKTVFSSFLGTCIKPFCFLNIVKKIYGGVSYSVDISNCFENKYQVISFAEGIHRTYE